MVLIWLSSKSDDTRFLMVASNFAQIRATYPFERRVQTVALAPSELFRVADRPTLCEHSYHRPTVRPPARCGPSIQPSSASACVYAETIIFATASFSSNMMSTPMRRMRSPCCARLA